MNYRIKAPNKEYTGESAGVHFINGVGIAKDGKSVDWFKDKGYEVEPIIVNEQNTPDVPEKNENTKKDISKMTKEELTTLAENNKIDISECKNNDERKAKIIDALKESEVNSDAEIKPDEDDSAEGSDVK